MIKNEQQPTYVTNKGQTRYTTTCIDFCEFQSKRDMLAFQKYGTSAFMENFHYPDEGVDMKCEETFIEGVKKESRTVDEFLDELWDSGKYYYTMTYETEVDIEDATGEVVDIDGGCSNPVYIGRQQIF